MQLIVEAHVILPFICQIAELENVTVLIKTVTHGEFIPSDQVEKSGLGIGDELTLVCSDGTVPISGHHIIHR